LEHHKRANFQEAIKSTYILEIRSKLPSGGVVVTQMETFHKYDGWKQMGRGQEEILELFAEVINSSKKGTKLHSVVVSLRARKRWATLL